MSRTIIVGAGVVGTATGKGLAMHGHSVSFIDTNIERVRQLTAEGMAASTTMDLSGPPATVFLCLPTPSNTNGYDLSAFLAGTAAVGDAMKGASAFHTVVVRSTVPPGTCDNLVTPLLEHRSGRVAGTHFAVASNPEFLRAVCALEDVLHPWMTVIASKSKRTVERLSELLAPFGGEVRTYSDTVSAELVKCAHNLFNATKISFWNEIWLVARELGIDNIDAISATVAKSAEGSISPEYGIKAGHAYGGACLPKDTLGFLGFARRLGVETPLLDGVIRVNGFVEAATLPSLDRLLDEGAHPEGSHKEETPARVPDGARPSN